jgi:hypothetical protein
MLDYLTEKAETPREWLRRSPRDTHPEILRLVREFREAGGFYDDDALRFVAERGDVPPELHKVLGSEIYVAKGMISDERAREKAAALIADGFEPLDESRLVEGARYEIATSTTYCGQDEPTYSEPRPVRAKRNGTGFYFLPKGARTHGFRSSGPALIRKA